MVKEFTISCLERRGGRGILCEGNAKMLVEGFAILIIPLIHGTGARSGLTDVLVSRVGIGVLGSFRDGLGE